MNSEFESLMPTPVPQEQPQTINTSASDSDRDSHLPSGKDDSTSGVPTTDLDGYNFHKTRIIVHLEILPSSEDNQNRTVSIGVGIKNDPPLLTTTTLSSLNLPPVIQQMLEELESQMPERAAAAVERKKRLQQLTVQRELSTPASTCNLPPAKPLSQTDSSPTEQHQLTLF
ncbi:hypothetical protein [Coleofasciculus sp.]|uniref:hypothetical protein n=1 Tax=Coleofasciculus sp. TaxID=3100458 RepID=UPI0039F9D7BE